jgi:enoyl-CoA hydratase/carnithine racemase
MGNEHILVEQHEQVLRITMNRPEKKNALTVAMYSALVEAMEKAETDKSIRVTLFTGQGDAFTAGNDVMDFMNNPPTSSDSPVSQFLLAISTAAKPIVAAVNGSAVGIGTTMLLHCDLVYASDRARFKMPFVNLGLCPEAGSSLLLPQLMGHVRAAQYLLLGEEFDADTARELHLVNEITAPEELAEVAFKKAQLLAALPPAAVRLSKRLMKESQTGTVQQAMEREGEEFMQRLTSPEAMEAFMAFAQRRQPDFSQFD